MRVLGIDPGSRYTGLGVVEVSGQDLRAISSRCIKMRNEPLPVRLGLIYRGVKSIIQEFQPDVVAVEHAAEQHRVLLGQAVPGVLCGGEDTVP